MTSSPDNITPLVWPAIDEDLIAPLPPIIKAVVKALGLGHANIFLRNFGGTRVYITIINTATLGLTTNEHQCLRQTLAPHMSQGNHVWLPKADKLFNQVRDAEIIKNASTQSLPTQARQYNLTTRQIGNLRRGLTKDEKQRESASRKSMVFSAEELQALEMLTQREIAAGDFAPVYAKLLNKLNRAQLLASESNPSAQFDLFG